MPSSSSKADGHCDTETREFAGRALGNSQLPKLPSARPVGRTLVRLLGVGIFKAQPRNPAEPASSSGRPFARHQPATCPAYRTHGNQSPGGVPFAIDAERDLTQRDGRRERFDSSGPSAMLTRTHLPLLTATLSSDARRAAARGAYTACADVTATPLTPTPLQIASSAVASRARSRSPRCHCLAARPLIVTVPVKSPFARIVLTVIPRRTARRLRAGEGGVPTSAISTIRAAVLDVSLNPPSGERVEQSSRTWAVRRVSV